MSLDDLKGGGGRKAQMLRANREHILAYYEQFGREAVCEAYFMSERTLDRILMNEPCRDPGLSDSLEVRVNRLEHRQQGYEGTQDIMRNELAIGRESRLEQLRQTKELNRIGQQLLDQHEQLVNEVADKLLERVRPLVALLLRRLFPEHEATVYKELLEQSDEVVHIMQNVRRPFKPQVHRVTFESPSSHNVYYVGQRLQSELESDDPDIVVYPAAGLDSIQPGTFPNGDYTGGPFVSEEPL